MALHGDQEKNPQQPNNTQQLENPQEHQVLKESKDSQELQIPEELKEPQQPQHQQLMKTVDLSSLEFNQCSICSLAKTSPVKSDPTWCTNTV